MVLKFPLTYWGCENYSAQAFLDKAVQEGWDGVEINLPVCPAFESELVAGLVPLRQQWPDFVFILQLVPAFPGSFQEELQVYESNLLRLAKLQPDFINAHTGRDFYSFEENCRFIEAASDVTARTGVPIRHETHRGRFSFHLPTLMPYQERFPDLELTADLSHFCTVSESLLEGQKKLLERMIPRVKHLHARIGYQQGPQANDPRAPEWSAHVETYLGWWDRIFHQKKEEGLDDFTITPEFGPAPYMPAAPYSQEPLADQKALNLWMRDVVRERWGEIISID